MRIGIVSSLLHPSYGGPPAVVRMHVDALKSLADVSVYGCTPTHKAHEIEALLPNVHLFPETWPRKWFRGAGLYSRLMKDVGGFDVIHAHMLWDYPTWASWRIARRTGRPFVVTPHGSLSASWRTRSPHKRIYRRFVLEPMFRDLGALHVLNKAEAEACQGWIAPSRIVVIPNGLPYDDYTRSRDPQLARQKWPFLVDRRVMLYLGRLWWQKGLERLVEAWCAAAPNDEWLLVLAGPDYRGYEAKLRSRIADLGAEARIHLTGAVSGDLKESLLAASACFVLPSLGEGFSMALLEAMAAGLPAIYTKECHFSELAAHQGGWEIPQGQTPLSDAILHVCSMAPSTLATVGERARMLGSTEYSAEAVAQKLLHVYRSLV